MRIFLSIVLMCLTFNLGTAQLRLPLNRTPIEYGNNLAAGKYYDVRGIKMYCEQYGKGQPLLIIPPHGGSIKNFINQIPYFSSKYRVIIADSRAQGNSKDNLNDSLSYEMMADDFAALLTTLKIDSAYVIGWSDGGINGLLLAMRHPEKVKKLAITGAHLWPDTTAIYPEFANLFQARYNGLLKKTQMNAKQKKQWKFWRLLFEQPHIPLNDLHTIQAPVLVISGDHDVIREEHTMLIYKNIPKSYLWIIPNAGHSTPVNHSESFNKTVDAFFKTRFRKFVMLERFR